MLLRPHFASDCRVGYNTPSASKNLCCPTHSVGYAGRCLVGPEHNHPACWARDNQLAPVVPAPPTFHSGSSSRSSTNMDGLPPPPPPGPAPQGVRHVPGPPPPPQRVSGFWAPALQVVQCSTRLCKMSYSVCDVCATRRVAWNRDPHAARTTATDHVLRLVHALNQLPASEFPPQILDTAGDSDLRRAASYDPAAGHGDEGEADVGNTAGSALFLAAALPEIYGVPYTTPMKCFGYPLPDNLLSVSTAPQRSGKGVDNRRTNVWEAVLSHWQQQPHRATERDLLQAALVAMRVGVDSVDRGFSWQVARRALQKDVTPQLGARPRASHGQMV